MLEPLTKRAVVTANLAAAIIGLGGCETSDQGTAAPTSVDTVSVSAPVPLRIYSSPYQAVDWSNDLRLTAQHHDHIGMRTDFILAYDAAGYDVVSLMDYSGNTELPYSVRQRIWPVDQWVPRSLAVNLKSIKLFLPNAEEVGTEVKGPWDPAKHATSPFLKTYIEGGPPPRIGAPELPLLPNQYRSVEQLFALISSLGGFPCLAHPWNYKYTHLDLGDSYCVEIFSAHADAIRERGVAFYTERDRNEATVGTWDEVLRGNQRVFGIGVNDHFGPQASPDSASRRTRDSGKIVVLAKAATLAAYEQAFRSGSFFAVRDYGEVKNRFPVVHSITVGESFVYIETTANVRWIAEGQVAGNEPMLRYENLPQGAHYVRAEITSPIDDSRVYTQAFSVRPVGDVDGDYDTDEQDNTLCLAGGAITSAVRDACAVGSSIR